MQVLGCDGVVTSGVMAANGKLVTWVADGTNAVLANCSTGWQVVDAATLGLSQIALLFEAPDPVLFGQSLMAGFGIPLMVYFTAWGYQQVIGWFDIKTER